MNNNKDIIMTEKEMIGKRFLLLSPSFVCKVIETLYTKIKRLEIPRSIQTNG
jgi:hypothetical protein